MAGKARQILPAKRPPPQKSKPVATLPDVEGGLLEITPLGIVGWARHPGQPALPVKIVLEIAGKPVASTVADRFDIPSVRAELGAAMPGFAVQLPQTPTAAPPYEIFARSAQGALLGWPLLVRSAEDILPAIHPAARVSYEGMVEHMKDGKLTGWAWNKARPEQELTLTLLDGQQKLAQTVANLHRNDLQRAGKRGGACGFSFDLPATLLDMRPHSLRVLADDGGELANSPLTFGPATLSKLLEELLHLRDEVKRLSTLVAGGNAAGHAYHNGLARTNDMVRRGLEVNLQPVDGR